MEPGTHGLDETRGGGPEGRAGRAPEVSDDGVEEERRVEEGEIARGVQEAVPGRGLTHRLDY